MVAGEGEGEVAVAEAGSCCDGGHELASLMLGRAVERPSDSVRQGAMYGIVRPLCSSLSSRSCGCIHLQRQACACTAVDGVDPQVARPLFSLHLHCSAARKLRGVVLPVFDKVYAS